MLLGNHFAFVTGFPSAVAEAVELTLASRAAEVAILDIAAGRGVR